jgi:hypothetical protein
MEPEIAAPPTEPETASVVPDDSKKRKRDSESQDSDVPDAKKAKNEDDKTPLETSRPEETASELAKVDEASKKKKPMVVDGKKKVRRNQSWYP